MYVYIEDDTKEPYYYEMKVKISSRGIVSLIVQLFLYVCVQKGAEKLLI